MVPVFYSQHSSDHDDRNGGWPESRAVLGAVIGTAAIAATVTLLAAASAGLGIGPQLPAIAYLLVAISAIMIWIHYMITLIRDATHAGLYMSGFWVVALFVLFVVFKYFG